MSWKMWFHGGLEHDRSIGEPHWHDQELEGAIMHSEGCLPLMSGCDMNIVVARMEVKAWCRPFHCPVSQGELVISGIRYQSFQVILLRFQKSTQSCKCAILLLSKENRCTA